MSAIAYLLRTTLATVLALSLAACIIAPHSQGPFQAFRAPGLTKPEAELENKTQYSIRVEMQGVMPSIVDIEPYQKKAIALTPGDYAFLVSIPSNSSVRPFQGRQTFHSNNRYRWAFYIKTR